MKIGELRALPWRQNLSLDTGETQVNVYGDNFQDYLSVITETQETFVKQFTVTRAKLLDERRAYSSSGFFVTKDGYLSDRRAVLAELLDAFEAFALEYQRQYPLLGKPKVVKYNLKLTAYLVGDMLTFVKALNVQSRSIPRD